MSSASEITETALQLPEDERAKLASDLLCSLPSMLHDDDEGVAEALRRDAESDKDPSAGLTMKEFRQAFGR